MTHQNNSTRCSLRSKQIFRHFFEYAAAVLNNVATFIGNGLQSASVGRLWSYVNSELNRKAVVENCLRQCAILVSSQKKKTICWNVIVGNFSHLILVSKSTWGLQCQGNHEHVWKQTSEGKREYPSAMIRRLVNGLSMISVLPQLHMFLSEADRILSSFPAVFVVSSAQEKTRRIFHQRNLNVFES